MKFSLCSSDLPSFRARAASLGYLSSAGIYEDKDAYPTAVDIPNIKIFRFEENIYYANIDMFKKLFIKRIAFRVDDQIKAMNNEIAKVESEYKSRLAKPNKYVENLKRRFLKDDTVHRDEMIGNGTSETDSNRLIEEKQEKILEIRKKYRPDFDHIIVDCSPVNYIDMMGIKTLIQVEDYSEIIQMILSFCFPALQRLSRNRRYCSTLSRST